MTIEREAKLTAAARVHLDGLDGFIDDLSAATPAERHLDAVYYDTAQLDLARWGITLRHRSGEVGPPWTLKLPEGKAGQALIRRELTFEGPLRLSRPLPTTWSAPTCGHVLSPRSHDSAPTGPHSCSATRPASGWPRSTMTALPCTKVHGGSRSSARSKSRSLRKAEHAFANIAEWSTRRKPRSCAGRSPCSLRRRRAGSAGSGRSRSGGPRVRRWIFDQPRGVKRIVSDAV